jgi:pimeloyl-ACP methyl ester carboxylesterase
MNNNQELTSHTIGIVFIHGAGMNSSIWQAVKTQTSNPILHIDFPNRKSEGDQNAHLTLDDYVKSTVAKITNWEHSHFIIVAHSIGACVGLKVAEHFKNELKGFVAIGSVIPKSGQSFASSMPFPQSILLPIILTLLGTKPPKKMIEAELCNDLTPEATSRIVSEFTPEAKELYTTKIRFELPDTKRLYIKLTNDKSIPIELQEKMVQNLKATTTEVMDSGHLPMLSKPTELARVLNEFINK